MKAGDLNSIVEIQDFTESQDPDTGDDVKTWGAGTNSFAVVPAKVRTLSGRELYAAQQQFAEANAEITIRYLPGVVEGMRILHEDEDHGTAVYYDILNVDDVERRHVEMIITCKTGLLGA